MSTVMNKSTHDEINLTRLVRRLEKTAADPSWSTPEDDHWLKSLDLMQKVKYARSLIAKVELYDYDPTPASAKRLHTFRETLDSVETLARHVEQRTAPKPRRPEPILSTLLVPQEPKASLPDSQPLEPAAATDNLLLSPAEPSPAITIPDLIPLQSASVPAAKSSSVSPQFLHNTNALHDELSGQLEQMAAQLLRNARHFNDALAKDQTVVEGMETKLEGNFDMAKKERIRLRDHRGKSGMTTCWYIWVVIGVTALFMLMVMLIRLT